MTNLTRTLFFSIALGLVSGCTSLGALNAVLPKDQNTQNVIKDIAYGIESRQMLDIYLPSGEEKATVKRPVVVFFYGGAWNSGKRQEYSFVGHSLNAKGYIAVIADYRLVPEVRYPDFVFDSARAVAWVAENISTYGGDQNSLFVAGHSAGAYNAMMVGLADTAYEDQGVSIPRVAGVIGLAGPYDFLPLKWPATKAAFEGTDELIKTQPATYLNKKSPPLLLITGDDDMRVDPRHSRKINRLAVERGVSAEFHSYPGVGHAKLLLSLAKPFRSWAPTLEQINQFILRHSG